MKSRKLNNDIAERAAELLARIIFDTLLERKKHFKGAINKNNRLRR